MTTITKEFLTELGWKVNEEKEINSNFQEIAKLFDYILFLYLSDSSKNNKKKITTECSIFDYRTARTVFIGSIKDKDFFEMVTCSEVYRGRLSKTIIRKLGWEFQNPNLALLNGFEMLIDYPADSNFVHEASYKIKNPKGEIIFAGKLETNTDFRTVMKTLGIEVQEVRWSKD